MDVLFTATIPVNGENRKCDIVFNNEAYHFRSADSGSDLFSLRREDDEWHSSDQIDEPAKAAAIEALETYLLSQH